MKTRNNELLESFTIFCKAYPEQRFWQALRNWSGNFFILINDGKETSDTFGSNKQNGQDDNKTIGTITANAGVV
jgi:hypothetical protein